MIWCKLSILTTLSSQIKFSHFKCASFIFLWPLLAMVVAMKQSLDSSVFLKLASVIILQNCLLAHQRMITEYGILPKDMKMSQREIKGVLFAGKSWNFSFVCSIFWFYCEYESRQANGRSCLVALAGPSLFVQLNTQQYIVALQPTAQHWELNFSLAGFGLPDNLNLMAMPVLFGFHSLWTHWTRSL